jgi:hypothetical protein
MTGTREAFEQLRSTLAEVLEFDDAKLWSDESCSSRWASSRRSVGSSTRTAPPLRVRSLSALELNSVSSVSRPAGHAVPPSS